MVNTLVLDSLKDSHNYKQINNPRQVVLEMITCELKDIFRFCHPEDMRYTWRRKSPLKQGRLDYCLISGGMTDIVEDCSIRPGYQSELKLAFSNFEIGRGVWELNNSICV